MKDKLEDLILPIVIIVITIILGLCWCYTVNTWLIFFDKTPSLKLWQGIIIGLIPYLDKLSVPITILTFILMFFIS
jgi:hypothetical protein